MPTEPLFSPEVGVPGCISGHLDLDGAEVLQANDLSELGEGVMQPGRRGALQAQAWLEADASSQKGTQGPTEVQCRADRFGKARRGCPGP